MKLTQKQNEYIRNAHARWNIKSGAVRSGKSFVDIAYMIPHRIRERAGKPGLNAILGVSRDTIERNVLRPMREIYTDANIGYINNKNLCLIGGEEVYCLGAEKISQVAKIQGASIKYAYGDEIAKWNKDVFEILKSRLDKPYSCFDGACNPENPTHWLKQFIDSGVDIYLQHYRIFDNPYLPPEFVQNLCKEYEGTIYYDRLIDGKWKRAEGAIYRKFADNPQRYTRPAENIERIVCGVDFGGNGSGHAFCATGKCRGSRVHVLRTEKHMNSDFPTGINATLLTRLFLDFLTKVIETYGMPEYVYYDSAETVLGQSLRDACRISYPEITVLPARKKRIKDRIDYVVRLMGVDLFAITSDCDTLSHALQDAVWNPKKTDEDERLDDGSTDIDSLDAFEYTIERDINGTRLEDTRGMII